MIFLVAGIILALAGLVIRWQFELWCEARRKEMFEEFERTFPDSCAVCSYTRHLRQNGIDTGPTPAHRCKRRLRQLYPDGKAPP